MAAEIQALELNKTWILTPLPMHKTAIGCKWVYIVKFKADETIYDVRRTLLLKVILKRKVWIIMRHLHLLQKWLLYVVS